MVAESRIKIIAGHLSTLITPINVLTVGSVALVVVTKTAASAPLSLILIVKMVLMVAAIVNWMQRHYYFSVRIQVSTGTLLRENTYRTNVPFLRVGFIGAQSISYL
jgi:uncharacterized membrane protein YdbT with pleckstrin-like domain